MPASELPVSDQYVAPDPGESSGMTPRNVLMLVDDPIVRRFLTVVMERHGCRVVAFGPCVEPRVAGGCELACCADGVTPDVVVLEIIAPRLCSGTEAAHKALRRWPGIKLLLTSTTARSDWDTDVIQQFDSLPPDAYVFLPKPFAAPELQAALRALPDLEGNARSSLGPRRTACSGVGGRVRRRRLSGNGPFRPILRSLFCQCAGADRRRSLSGLNTDILPASE